jgi:hypothetical protein
MEAKSDDQSADTVIRLDFLDAGPFTAGFGCVSEDPAVNGPASTTLR